MEELFYTKYKNLHITNDLNVIDPYKLSKGDGICVLYGDDVNQYNLKFKEIKNKNVVRFTRDERKLEQDYYVRYDGWYGENDENVEDFYYNNNQYISLTLERSYTIMSSTCIKHVTKISKYNTNSKYISGTFNDDTIYSYLIFPSEDNKYIKLLLNIGISVKRDYLIYLKAVDDFGYFDQEVYKVNLLNMIQTIDVKKTKSIQWFEDFLFCKDYNTKKYIEDKDRDKNLEFVSNFLQTNFNETHKINLCFENKELNLKSYLENNYVIISHNDYVIDFSAGLNKIDYAIRRVKDGKYFNEIYTEDEEFQNWYRIAYSIANFEKDHTGINPKTGNYEIEGTINNDNIIYRDNEHIIVKNRGDKDCYKKVYDQYFILTKNQKEIEEIFDLYETFITLSEN